MGLTKNHRAVALYSGCIGAFLESSSNRLDVGHDVDHLERCRIWLLNNNPLFQRYDIRAELQLHPLPTASISTLTVNEETRPMYYPDLVMNPIDYLPETANEDHRGFRLPVGLMSDPNSSHRPLSISRSDPALELLLFPVLYPWGRGQWTWQSKATRIPYKNTRLVDTKLKLNCAISHFRDDHYWPAWTYMEIEAARIFQNTARLIKGQAQRSADHQYTGSQLLQPSQYGAWSVVNEELTTTIPKFIRTGDTFFVNAEAKIRCMLQTFGIPTLFITTTFSERWPKYQQILQQSGNQDTLPSNRPWDAVQYYYERWHWIKASYLRAPAVSEFGRLQELVERHEFQLRGAIHTHSLLWSEKSQQELIQLDFIRADVPDPITEPELYRLVMMHQIHRCDNRLCGGGDSTLGPCRKGFPAQLSSVTYQKPGELRYTYRRLSAADQYVVPYSPHLLLLWQAHCNVQYCTSGGLAKYISKYVTKAEPKSLVNIHSENHTASHLLARRMGSMEVMVLLLSFPIFQMSSACMYLPTAIPSERVSVVKPAWLLERQGDEDTPYYADALEKYFARPNQATFNHLTYFKYHSEYTIECHRRKSKSPYWQDLLGNYIYCRKKVIHYTPVHKCNCTNLSISLSLYEQHIDVFPMGNHFSSTNYWNLMHGDRTLIFLAMDFISPTKNTY